MAHLEGGRQQRDNKSLSTLNSAAKSLTQHDRGEAIPGSSLETEIFGRVAVSRESLVSVVPGEVRRVSSDIHTDCPDCSSE